MSPKAIGSRTPGSGAGFGRDRSVTSFEPRSKESRPCEFRARAGGSGPSCRTIRPDDGRRWPMSHRRVRRRDPADLDALCRPPSDHGVGTKDIDHVGPAQGSWPFSRTRPHRCPPSSVGGGSRTHRRRPPSRCRRFEGCATPDGMEASLGSRATPRRHRARSSCHTGRRTLQNQRTVHARTGLGLRAHEVEVLQAGRKGQLNSARRRDDRGCRSLLAGSPAGLAGGFRKPAVCISGRTPGDPDSLLRAGPRRLRTRGQPSVVGSAETVADRKPDGAAPGTRRRIANCANEAPGTTSDAKWRLLPHRMAGAS
ncbi:hypothetical protein BHAOGJBA_2894 [Methylobacterium hispanicum]|uniref:Uncharacterized protein n=1 Tax=Methylobacterium hispanicum TaxID=270350 RepID=A0AAV4ZMF6_9HYPH|nr:hypothetical protein BHAOGJBA_2894 [Methylobacterium hispanicum]